MNVTNWLSEGGRRAKRDFFSFFFFLLRLFFLDPLTDCVRGACVHGPDSLLWPPLVLLLPSSIVQIGYVRTAKSIDPCTKFVFVVCYPLPKKGWNGLPILLSVKRRYWHESSVVQLCAVSQSDSSHSPPLAPPRTEMDSWSLCSRPLILLPSSNLFLGGNSRHARNMSMGLDNRHYWPALHCITVLRALHNCWDCELVATCPSPSRRAINNPKKMVE